MSIAIKTTNDPKIAAEFIAGKILDQLKNGKNVFWLVPGGSAIAVAVLASKIIAKYPHENLTVTLTDERYGEVFHKDSNLLQMLDSGFDLPQAKLLSVLAGADRVMTTEKFNTIIGDGFKNTDYQIGLFGVGADGHTAGILPESAAVEAPNWATSYVAQKFERVTVTFKTIENLNEAVVWAQGKEKWEVIKDMTEKEIDVKKQPAQILKKVPALTIFTDKK